MAYRDAMAFSSAGAPERTLAAWPLILAAAVLAALAIGWIGYTASDDAAYYEAASAWLRHSPAIAPDHWATRYPLILSVVAALALIPAPPLAMAIVALAWYAVFLLIARDLARRIAGPRAGWIAAILLATLPVVVAQATTLSCDLAEAAFLMIGVRLAGDCAAGAAARTKPFVAGLAFGAAILCRETTALALIGFVPLLLLGRPLHRRTLLWIAAGGGVLLGGEALFQWALTGDALHRWALAFHHDSHIDRAANLEGNLLVHPAIDPLLVLLVNDDFALLFWLAGGAALLGAWRIPGSEARGRLTILFALAGAAFLLVGALTTKLVLNPRYFMLPAIAAAILVAIWLDRLPTRPRALLLGSAAAANLLMLSVENAHPRWAAEALVRAAAAHPRLPIVGDAEIVHRATYPLAWSGLRNVAAGLPRAGELTVSEAARVPATAIVVAQYPSPPTMLGALLRSVRLDGALPDRIQRRLISPNPTQVLWRARSGN